MLTALSKDSQGLTGYLNAQGNYLAAQVKYPGCGKTKFKCHYSGEGVSPELPPLCRIFWEVLLCMAHMNIQQDKESKFVNYDMVVKAFKKWVLYPTLSGI